MFTELARGRPLVISVNGNFDHGGHFLRLVEGVPGIQPHGSSSGGALFVLPAQAAARVAPVGDAWPAMVRAAPVDTLEIDLGTTRVVRTIGFAVDWRYLELDRRVADRRIAGRPDVVYGLGRLDGRSGIRGCRAAAARGTGPAYSAGRAGALPADPPRGAMARAGNQSVWAEVGPARRRR